MLQEKSAGVVNVRILFLKKRFVLGIFVIIMLIITSIVFVSNIFQKTVPTISPIYIGNTKERAVALMVNVDWGEDVLPDMLNIFQANNIKVTFFITGRFAKNFPDIVKKIAAEGHEIGNHGYSHPHPDKISKEKNKEEIIITEKIFKDLGIISRPIFAPAYGEHKQHVVDAAHELGYKTLMWTVDTVDWQNPSPNTIIQKIIKRADNGALILMHPKKCTLDALPNIIKSLVKEKFVFKKVTEIIQ